MPHAAPSPLARLLRATLLVVAGVAMLARGAHAQDSATASDSVDVWPDGVLRSPVASREELTRAAEALEKAAGRRGDARETRLQQARRIRRRLTEGDFGPGDRLYLAIIASMPFADTVTVRAGGLITVPNVGDFDLRGVLRSELQAHLTAGVARYLRDARVRAEALVRVAMLGPVGRPGFYWFPADLQINDAVMRAGGPSGSADLARTVIRHDGEELWGTANTGEAMRRGWTLDQLGLYSGDEIVVGEKKVKNWTSTMQVATTLLSIGFAIYGISRR